MTVRPIRKVVIANRGEIALRIVRACRELEIATVAVYAASEPDALHVRAADEAYVLPPFSALPYLNGEGILAIARQAGADAVHPGYGFLAENGAFARAVAAAGLIFIGPAADAIDRMGDKIAARQIALDAGITPVPGTVEPLADAQAAVAWAEEYGYPIAVKASGGGGGRGFRVARSAAELPEAFAGSRGEAERYFANPDVYLERYLEQPRHIEIQVFADNHGAIVAFPERDCSIQRRHQKLVEESPSPAVSPELRAAFGAAAVRLCEEVDYRGAGTIEFLLDEQGHFYFLEMNTRIQVEHTITEMVTGIDLVKEQLRVAAGEPLSFTGTDVAPCGWAIEARINAEDAGRNFAPSSGTVTTYRQPAGFGVRVDAALAEGGAVAPEFDSLIAKLVTWGRDRGEALARMRRALHDFEVAGVPSTIPFHRNVMAHPAYIAGRASTTFVTDYPEVLPPAAKAVTALPAQPEASRDLVVEVGGRRFDVRVRGELTVVAATTVGNRRTPRERRGRAAVSTSGNSDALSSPVQGTVVRVAVSEGDTVASGDLICVVEAMKMENEVTAHRSGTVSALAVAPGASIALGAPVATITD